MITLDVDVWDTCKPDFRTRPSIGENFKGPYLRSSDLKCNEEAIVKRHM